MRIGCVLIAMGALLASELGAQTLGAVHRFHRLAPDIVVAEPRYGGGNSTLVVNDDHVVVIDSQGSGAAAAALIEEIRRLTPNPVRYVVNTHWHGDHHGGNRAFRQAFPDVEILAHPETVRGIRERANREIHGVAPFLRNALRPAEEALRSRAREGRPLGTAELEELARFVEAEISFLEAVPPDFTYALPDRPVEDRLVLTEGGRRIEIRHPGPGHTSGDLLVVLPDDGIVVAGDVVTVPYVVPRSGFPHAYSRVLAGLVAEPHDVLVPGHGPPGDHRELLVLMAEFLDAVAGSVRAGVDGGLAHAEAVEAAVRDPALASYEARIDWQAEGGLRFLDYEALLRMTADRAAVELGSPP